MSRPTGLAGEAGVEVVEVRDTAALVQEINSHLLELGIRQR